MGMPNVVPLPAGEFQTGEPGSFVTNPRIKVHRGDLVYVGQGDRILKWIEVRSDGEAEVPVKEAISEKGTVTYGRVFQGRWRPGSSASSPPCVRCLSGKECPPGVPTFIPCCPA